MSPKTHFPATVANQDAMLCHTGEKCVPNGKFVIQIW